MEDWSDTLYVRPIVQLPPPEYRLYNPEMDGRIATPLDERGLVDAPALFQVIAETIDPSYDWSSSKPDSHHLQWPNRWYGDEAGNPSERTANPQKFRDIAIGRWMLPRVMHNWIHEVTIPPPLPSPEVMFYRSEAQRATRALFMTVRKGRRSIDSARVTERKTHAKLTPTYRQIAHQLNALQTLPPEFRLVDLSNYHSGNIPDVLKIEATLGRCTTARTAVEALALVRRANNLRRDDAA